MVNRPIFDFLGVFSGKKKKNLPTYCWNFNSIFGFFLLAGDRCSIPTEDEVNAMICGGERKSIRKYKENTKKRPNLDCRTVQSDSYMIRKKLFLPRF